MHRILWVLMASAMFAGCAAIQPPHDEAPVIWDIAPLASFEHGGAPSASTLHVLRPTAVAALSTVEIAYLSQDFERRYYARNRWADEPARLLHPRFVAAIEDAGLYASVVASASGTQAQRRLETDLLRFEIDFRDRAQGIARVEFRARLVDTGTGAILATRRFDAAINAREATPAAAVTALNEAFAHTLHSLTDWLRVGPR